MILLSYSLLIIGIFLASSLVGCTSKKALNLMPTSVIYQNSLINPFAHLTDVSKGQEIRGFDITGHHYWYRHPWMSSDIIFLMRTNLPPHRRGLSATELEGIRYLAEDYPEKIKNAAEIELGGQW